MYPYTLITVNEFQEINFRTRFALVFAKFAFSLSFLLPTGAVINFPMNPFEVITITDFRETICGPDLRWL